MKKMLIALSMLGLVSVSYAGETSPINANSGSVFAGVTASNNSSGDSGTGYNIGVSYNAYQTEHIFVQPSIEYATSGNSYGDKYLIGNLDVGYTFNLSNGMSVSPKAGFGIFHVIATDSHDTQVAYNAGLDFAVTKQVTVGLQYVYSQGSNGHHVDLTTLSVGYKF